MLSNVSHIISFEQVLNLKLKHKMLSSIFTIILELFIWLIYFVVGCIYFTIWIGISLQMIFFSSFIQTPSFFLFILYLLTVKKVKIILYYVSNKECVSWSKNFCSFIFFITLKVFIYYFITSNITSYFCPYMIDQYPNGDCNFKFSPKF